MNWTKLVFWAVIILLATLILSPSGILDRYAVIHDNVDSNSKQIHLLIQDKWTNRLTFKLYDFSGNSLGGWEK